MTRLLRPGAVALLAASLLGLPVVARGAELLPQSITFAEPTGVVVGRELALTAASSSGLQVTYVAQTPATCAVSGTTLTPIAAGECRVTANQAGDATFAAAEPVTVTIVIGVAPGLIALRQQFFIGGEERLSVPIWTRLGTRVEMRLVTDPVLVGQLVEVWWQVDRTPWRLLTTRRIESATRAARYLFTVNRRSVAYRWRFPGNEEFAPGWSAARRIYGR